MAVGSLAAQGQALLDAAYAGLALATTTHDPPTHRFRSHGLPNLELCCDDGVLAVWLERIEHRPTDPRGCHGDNYFHWVIGLYRCWPTGDGVIPPTAAAYDDAAADLLEDAWALVTEFYDRLRVPANSVFSGCECEDIELGDLTPSEIEPSGGCAGFEFRVVVGAACLTDTGS